jgi:hypothetical protein
MASEASHGGRLCLGHNIAGPFPMAASGRQLPNLLTPACRRVQSAEIGQYPTLAPLFCRAWQGGRPMFPEVAHAILLICDIKHFLDRYR